MLQLRYLKLPMARDIENALRIREEKNKVLHTPPVLASVFLHYKFGVLLNESEKRTAVEHIIKLWNIVTAD